MFKILEKIFSSYNEREIKRMRKTVEKINELEKIYLTLTNDGLREQTNILKSRLKAGETLNDVLPYAFAVVREAAKRTLKERAYDVQLIGAIILHNGQIAEMKTGEGKTLVAVFAAYLNALEEKGVHVVTVNDYLAKRDSEWMGQIYRFLGLSVGCILQNMNDNERKKAYQCDITYGTNSEFGFDYLRDNMKIDVEELCQKPFNFAIVDEVDSILIDEARTPLIISGATDDNLKIYIDIDNIVKQIKDDLCIIDEKERTVILTEEGTEYIEETLKKLGFIKEQENMYDLEHTDLVHYINQSLKAHKLFKNDVDYLVKDDQVFIVDEFTGRIMDGRRFSDGLHQALEAKERVKIQNENQTLASITYQNYFRMYPKLAGMTGTAMTESEEFEFIYNLKVLEVPTNIKVARIDEDDVIYKTEKEKYKAIVNQIKECYEKKQPVLVGTVSIEKSELVSKLLKAEKIPHNVLNAKYHEKEAFIIAQAGKPSAITIATNMAGRGTDIKLGGNIDFEIKQIEADETIGEEDRRVKIQLLNEELAKNREMVLAAGGLFILGTERHESRRIDNQLRGRAGRQGDIGKSRFFLSLQDDLMRIFGSDKLANMLTRLGLKEDEAIFHPWISRSLENAQKKVENMHYESRKTVLKYDDVVNTQRKVIFEERKDIMFAKDIVPEIEYMIREKNNEFIDRFVVAFSGEWDLESMRTEFLDVYGLDLNFREFVNKEKDSPSVEKLVEFMSHAVEDMVDLKIEIYGKEVIQKMQKDILLLTIDRLWKDHLRNLDRIREGIGLRAYGQQEPLLEYKKEAFDLFENLMYNINEQTLKIFSKAKINVNNKSFKKIKETLEESSLVENREELIENLHLLPKKIDNVENNREKVSNSAKVGRNEPCPCGSGKKYKNCCGK